MNLCLFALCSYAGQGQPEEQPAQAIEAIWNQHKLITHMREVEKMARYLYGEILTGPRLRATIGVRTAATWRCCNTSSGAATTTRRSRQRRSVSRSASGPSSKTTNRSIGVFNVEEAKWAYREKDVYDPEKFADDDIFGFMNAQASQGGRRAGPRRERQPAASARSPRATIAMPGPLWRWPARVSLEPYQGELSFGRAGKEKDSTSLFSAEMHTTRYQYAFGLSLGELRKPERASLVLDGVLDPPPVAGSHTRFLFDFSPEVPGSRSAIATPTGSFTRSTGPKAGQRWPD